MKTMDRGGQTSTVPLPLVRRWRLWLDMGAGLHGLGRSALIIRKACEYHWPHGRALSFSRHLRRLHGRTMSRVSRPERVRRGKENSNAAPNRRVRRPPALQAVRTDREYVVAQGAV